MIIYQLNLFFIKNIKRSKLLKILGF
jgi:hypothetical protein